MSDKWIFILQRVQPSTWRWEWETKKVRVCGDSRVNNLLKWKSTGRKNNIGGTWIPGAKTEEVMKIAERELNEHPDTEILVIVAVHCDLTKLEPWYPGGYKVMLPDRLVDTKKIAQNVAMTVCRLQDKYPKLIVIFTLPYTPNFDRYNVHRTYTLQYNDQWQPGNKNLLRKFYENVQSVKHFWFNVASIFPFDLNHLFPRNGKIVDRENSPFFGSTTDGLHPDMVTAHHFWRDLFKTARGLATGRKEAKCQFLPIEHVKDLRGRPWKEQQRILENTIRRREEAETKKRLKDARLSITIQNDKLMEVVQIEDQIVRQPSTSAPQDQIICQPSTSTQSYVTENSMYVIQNEIVYEHNTTIQAVEHQARIKICSRIEAHIEAQLSTTTMRQEIAQIASNTLKSVMDNIRKE